MNTFELLAADREAVIRHQAEDPLRHTIRRRSADLTASRRRPVARRLRARLGEALVSTGTLIAGSAEECAPADAMGRPA